MTFCWDYGVKYQGGGYGVGWCGVWGCWRNWSIIKNKKTNVIKINYNKIVCIRCIISNKESYLVIVQWHTTTLFVYFDCSESWQAALEQPSPDTPSVVKGMESFKLPISGLWNLTRRPRPCFNIKTVFPCMGFTIMDRRYGNSCNGGITSINWYGSLYSNNLNYHFLW